MMGGVGFTVRYNVDSNAAISGVAIQYLASGARGSSVSVEPNSGYHFVKWSDENTSNPRTDSNVTADITVTSILEVDQTSESSNGSQSTDVGIRANKLKNLLATPAVTIASFVASVREFLNYLVQHEDDLEELPPEESNNIIIALRDILTFLLKFVAL